MTDLTGALTSTGAPLQSGLQHNAVAMRALRDRHAESDRARNEAEDAALQLCSAEDHVRTLQIRIRGAERRERDWATAAAVLPETVGSKDSFGPDVATLQRELTAAEGRVTDARQTHTAACDRFQAAQAAARDLQHRMYAVQGDPFAPAPEARVS